MKIQILFLVLISCVFICFESCKPSFTPQNYEYTNIESPIKGVEVAPENIKIAKGEQAKVIQLKNGSSLSIPDDAFVDENGNKITGAIELSYRQFDDAADIIASGIPMTYQSENGSTKQLESGGMFELKGTANGKPIFIAPNKSIQTNLASDKLGGYDFYYLNPNEKEGNYNWDKLTSEIDNPNAPKIQGVDSFQLKWNTKLYSELAFLKDIQWQLAEKEAVLNPNSSEKSWVLDQAWDKMSISQPRFMIKEGELFDTDSYAHRYKYIGDKILFIPFFSEGNNWRLYDWDMNLLEKNHIQEVSGDLVLVHNKKKTLFIKDHNLKLIKKIPEVEEDFYNEKTEEVVYLTINEVDKKLWDIVIVDKKGNEKFKKSYARKDIKYNHDLKIKSQEEYIIITGLKFIEVLDWNGTIKASFDIPTQYQSSINFAAYIRRERDLIILDDYSLSNDLITWNLKNKEQFIIPNTDRVHGHEIMFHPTKPLVLIPTEKNILLWNYETKKRIELVGTDADFINEQEDYLWIKEGKENYRIVDLNGKVLLKINGVETDLDNYWRKVVAEKDRILISFWEGDCKLYDSKFNLIKDFKEYDTKIKGTFFDKNEHVITYNSDGLVTTWNLNGEIEKRIFLEETGFQLDLDWQDSIKFISHKNNLKKQWSNNGNLLLDLNRAEISQINPNNPNEKLLCEHLKINYKHRTFLAETNTPLKDSTVYQLTLTNKNKTFRTYIYIDDVTMRKIDAYQIAYQKRRAKEENRKIEEEKLVRSFSINNFGIYNWDKFYKQNNEAIVRVEASFDLDEINRDENLCIFLITGEDKSVIIKYSKTDLDKFNFDKSMYNQLIAILQDGEIAVFSNEQFKKLDGDKLNAKKKHQFQMERMKGVDALEELKKITANPS